MSFRDGGACEFLSLLASAAACCFWWRWSCESCDWGAPLSQPSSLYPNLCMHHLRRPRPPSLSRGFLTWNWDCQRTSSSHVHAVDTISCGCSDQFAILPAGLSFLRCMTGQWDNVCVSETEKWLQQLLRTMLAPICVCMDENGLHSLKKSDTGTSHGHVHIGAHWVKVESPSK